MRTIQPPDGSISLRSGRRLYVGPKTAELLRRHHEAQELERMVAGPVDSDLVFCRDDGQPLRPGYVSKQFRQLAAAAGLPPIRLHAAREYPQVKRVGRLGLEPRTHGLKVRCSTIELTPRDLPGQ
jgi:hypothetical protein